MSCRGPAGHRVPLGAAGHGWQVWRDALLRSAGFPADGLAPFGAPSCAAAADALLGARDDDAAVLDRAFEAAFADAVAAGSVAVVRVAADPRFREAVTWQNTNALPTLDALVRDGADAPRTSRRRSREDAVLRYWQRYCLKNDTVGFFGPAAWMRVDPQVAEPVVVHPGPGLVRDRLVELEGWAVQACAETLAADPTVRRWLPPVLPPHLTLDGRLVRRPVQPPVQVTALEAAALAACDGDRPALEVVAGLRADPAPGLRQDADGFLLLDRLVARGLLQWDADLPMTQDAADVLVRRVQAIGDPEAHDRARAVVDRLLAARDRVAAAAGDPDVLRAALAALDAEFTALTGRQPRRRPGQTYASRALCVEDCSRDVEVVLGRPLLEDVAAPLSLLLHAARWFTGVLADAYAGALRDLYDELRGSGREVRLDELWFLAQGPLFGSSDRPVDAVARDFADRWMRVFGLDTLDAGTARLDLDSARLRPLVEQTFPSRPPTWSAAALHSPDLQICAESVDAIRRGEHLVVLGELHAAWPTVDSAVFTARHPDPDRLRAALAADLGPDRVRLLYPADFPRFTSRLADTLEGPTDRQLGFAPASGADRRRLLPVTSAVVEEMAGELVARVPDGRTWPLIEVVSALVAIHAVDGFKIVTSLPHTPRVTVDRLVLARETWRTTVGETGLGPVAGERPRYLAVRRWRASLGLPERVFVKLGTETKPSYVDLTSPQSAGSLCSMVRAARARGEEVPLAVTEMLPTAEQSWLPDAAGRRYSCELRLQVVDPLRPTAGEVR